MRLLYIINPKQMLIIEFLDLYCDL
jgi:hypothetical protein